MSAARVLTANNSARKLLAAKDGLHMEQDRLRIRTRALEARLTKVLTGIAMARRFNLPNPPGGALRVPTKSGESDWLLQVFPVEKKMAGTAVIFISTTATSRRPNESDLTNLFELSPMQRQIALRLFEGGLASDIADNLRITRNTFKTHFRRLLLKLGVSRQTELIRLSSKLKVRG
jgi:DNA-binding CsgD family transcriptional regulator